MSSKPPLRLPPFLLAIDTETSGFSYSADPSTDHQVVSVGALVIDSRSWEIADAFYVEVEHDSRFKWSDKAEAVHGLSQVYLKEHGEYIEDAAALFLQFVHKWFANTKIIAVGHRIRFDIDFINALLNTIDCELYWDRMVIDSAAMAGGLFGVVESDELFSILGFPERAEHNSLQDIELTVAAIKEMQRIFAAGLTSYT